MTDGQGTHLRHQILLICDTTTPLYSSHVRHQISLIRDTDTYTHMIASIRLGGTLGWGGVGWGIRLGGGVGWGGALGWVGGVGGV